MSLKQSLRAWSNSASHRARLVPLLALVVLLSSCGGGGGGNANSPLATPVITAPQQVTANQTGYTASVPDVSGVSYAWTINGGTITAGAFTRQVTFTAGAVGSVALSCVVTNSAGTASSPGTWTATIVNPPAISTFGATPPSITGGTTTSLAWTVSGANSLSIDQGIGTVTSQTSLTVSPPGTTTYTLTATNSAGTSITAQATVTVVAAPMISMFTATPGTVAGGTPVTLNATFTGGTGQISPGPIPISSGGNVVVTPTASQTYVLTVTNSLGATNTATAVVTVSSGFFATSGTLITPRFGHTATLLPNGKVLLVGGDGGNSLGTLASAELYDPASGTFAAAGSLNFAREGHVATLLPNGQVLITGGRSLRSGMTTLAAELYDPATGLFTTTGSMSSPFDTANLLSTGKVLVAHSGAGCCAGNFPSGAAELYDPATGTFAATGNMAMGGGGGGTVLLSDGRVLFPSGLYYSDTSARQFDDSETYSSATGLFTSNGNMITPRYNYGAALLATGQVVVTGGGITNYATISSAELFDPTTSMYIATGSMTARRQGHTATLLPSGKVLVAGGYTDDGGVQFAAATISAELFDPTNGTFTVTGTMNTNRYSHTATALPNGTVLIAGGITAAGVLPTYAEIYQ